MKKGYFPFLIKSVTFSHGYYILINSNNLENFSFLCHFHIYVNNSRITSLRRALNVVCLDLILTLQVVALFLLFKLSVCFHFVITPFLLSRDNQKDWAITCSLNHFHIS